MKLSELGKHEQAVLKQIHMSKEEQSRLLHLGFYPGTIIKFIRHAPMRDPSIYEVCGNEIILRKQDADHIEVEVVE